MRANLLSLSDDEWQQIESDLPADVRGKDEWMIAGAMSASCLF